MPDVLGYTLKQAKMHLEREGYSIGLVAVASPPRERTAEYNDGYRVIRCRFDDNQIAELLVCKPL